MAYWTGFDREPQNGPSLVQWVTETPEVTYLDDVGNEVVSRWWESGPTPGLTFRPTNCTPARCEPFQADPCLPGCADCGTVDPLTDCNDDCAETLPDDVTFLPFWIKKSYEVCELPHRQREIRSRLEAEHEGGRWSAIASKYYEEIGTRSESVSTAPVCAPEALGVLSAARSSVGGGVYVAPGYALPRLQEEGLAWPENGLAGISGSPRFRIGGRPLIIDDSFNRAAPGPGGTVAPDGSAWVYHLDGFPLVSTRPREYLQPKHRPGCALECCKLHEVRQRAIVAFNPCQSYGALVQVSC